MSLNDILQYQLIKTENLTITVYTVLVVLLILFLTRVLVSILKRIFNRYVFKKHIDMGRGQAIFQIIKYFIWILSISIVLETSGVKLTLLIAGSAALLVGLGLGLQQIFQDILSGVVILFEGSLKIGDVVELENNIVGKVRQIGLRTSLVETRDNINMIIPNSKFINNNVINWSHRETLTRFHVAVGVAYGSDVKLVEKLLQECAKNHEKVSKKHEPFVMFRDFGESSLDFQVYFWTNEAFRVERIKSDLRFKINEVFKQNNIQIPFPQRDLHIIDKK